VATRERRSRRRRLPPEEGRRALLEAGRDHLYENPLGEPLDHVRVTDIVSRMGLSIGAVYHYWESQDDYRDDLLELLLSPEQLPAVQQANETVAEVIDNHPDFEEMVRVVAAISFRGLDESPGRERLTLALLGYGNRDIDRRLGAQARQVSRRWAEFLATYYPEYGLEPRPPFTYESMAVVLMALVQGMNERRIVDADTVTPELEPGWDLFSSAALAFVIAASRPTTSGTDPAEGDRTLWDLARRVLPRRAPAQ
jgi:AcrR family transcriptional regulator